MILCFAADGDLNCEIKVAIRTPKLHVAEKMGIVIGRGKISSFSWSVISNRKFAIKNDSKNPASNMNESLRLWMIGTPALRRTAPRIIPRPVHNSAGVMYLTRKSSRKAPSVSSRGVGS